MTNVDNSEPAKDSAAAEFGSFYHRDFNVHTLGWKAFQDFVATLLMESLGFPPTIFGASGDGGRDAAFRIAATPSIGLGGTYTVQVKFASAKDTSLYMSDLHGEFAKATTLAQKGLARNYLIVSNCNISGPSNAAIVDAFCKIPGIEYCECLGVDWINQQIAENKRLRALVPRLYGLGDLSEILDERAYHQAQQILASMRDDVTKLVITKAYRRAATALLDKNFVLLLGEPAAGKSTIAAGLSLAANDLWQCRPLKLRRPSDFVNHWNANESAQFFWFDDAFGSTQFQQDLADEWNSIFAHVGAALSRGARILMTSRTYIYFRATQALKTSAFPLLRDSQVVIHVQDLSRQEKMQILYNHVKLGTQPRPFKQQIRPYLPRIANSRHFLPETARRLGDALFTRKLAFSNEAIDLFVSRPIDHLADVIGELDADCRCALAIIYMRNGQLQSPVSFDDAELSAIHRLGSTEAGAISALEHLKGTLTRLATSDTDAFWQFQHPTIRDAMANYVASRREYVDIYLSGTSAKQLVNEIVCGVHLEGAKVNVPRPRYAALLAKLSALPEDQLHSFLATRCGRAFLEAALAAFGEALFAALYPANSRAPSRPIRAFLQKLAEYDLLPETQRRSYIACLDRQVLFGDLSNMDDSSTALLLTLDEREQLLENVRGNFLDDIYSHIEKAAEDWNDLDDVDPETLFDDLMGALAIAENLLSGDKTAAQGIERARLEIDERIEAMREDWKPPDRDDDDRDYGSMGESVDSDATMFSDVAD